LLLRVNSTREIAKSYMAKKKVKASFKTTILRFNKMGEKTGWTYIVIPADVAEQLQPGNRKSFRVKGKLDDWKFEKTALLPMGEGEFIMPLNATARKGTGKRHGAMLQVELEVDERELTMNAALMDCLSEEPKALKYFHSLTRSHQQYISKWIDSAKTEETIAKRIGLALDALNKQLGFPEMMRMQKEKNKLAN
jgi:hypothetical protein